MRGFVSAIIVAGGQSARFGADKQFALLCGIPVIARTMAAFQHNARVNEIVVVTREEHIERVKTLATEYKIEKLTAVVAGGNTRGESVRNGVYAASKKCDLAAIHDGARPLVSDGIITSAIERAAKFHAAIPVVPVTSTIKRVENSVIRETPDRSELYEAQTPQVFNMDLLKAAIERGGDATDDASLVEALGAAVHTVAGSRLNIKITTPEDLTVAEALFKVLPCE
ncbi:MAG: 2-C-methyl-D-erythritol 4-phosphate cytidylyltransferase [Oscillospiraceae bacterium]|jgi:2-C-methyl-D-erythritol 4-phosphate cytidylyltransferase|nr:2-C-methyl-D-erythritol 4-phosphate cytidylyltransferase [Oscillospiraceae bacterium]